MTRIFSIKISLLLKNSCFGTCKRCGSTDSVLSPIKQYSILLEKGILKPDKNQFMAVNKLQVLFNELKINGFKRVGRNSGEEAAKSFQKGVYLHGEVGTGKTLLLDLFYNSVPISEKKRVHFNMFMLYLYSEINQWNLCCGTDKSHFITPSQHIANKILADCWLICFDEVQLADYASSVLLSGVFQHLIQNGAVIVATSNRPPNDLGEASFSDHKVIKGDCELLDLKTTFRNVFEQHCVVHHIDSNRDHRVEMKSGEQRFLYPKSVNKDLAFDKMFTELIPKGKKIHSSILQIYGRKIHIPLCAGNIARFTFSELCCHPLGPADYFKICSTFHSVFVDDIPKMTLFQKNEARRFLSFVDAAYECCVKVYCNSQASIDDIFQMLPKSSDHIQESSMSFENSHMTMDMLAEMAYDLNVSEMILHDFDFLTGQDEIFSFRRAISRLKEMQSGLYQQRSHREQSFVPYTGSFQERSSAYEKRREREHQRQTEIQKLTESKKLEKIVTEHNFNEVDWADEASYKTLSQEVLQKNYNERLKDAPKFNDSHFWGFGWWERLVNKKKPSDE